MKTLLLLTALSLTGCAAMVQPQNPVGPTREEIRAEARYEPVCTTTATDSDGNHWSTAPTTPMLANLLKSEGQPVAKVTTTQHCESLGNLNTERNVRLQAAVNSQLYDATH